MKFWHLIISVFYAALSIGQVDGDTINFVEEILAVNRAMEAAFNNNEFIEIAEYYTESAVVVGNNVEVKGHESLRKYWASFSHCVDWKLENIEIVALAKDVAIQRGYSNIRILEGSGTRLARCIFSLVWIRTNAGWKIELDHFSPR